MNFGAIEIISVMSYRIPTMLRAGQITGSHVIQLQITNYSQECNLNYQLQITLEFEAKLQIANQ